MKRMGALLLFMLVMGGIAQAAGLTGYACQGWGLTILTGPYICGTAPAPPSSGFLLKVDGVSFVLQTNASSKICLAGGC